MGYKAPASVMDGCIHLIQPAQSHFYSSVFEKKRLADLLVGRSNHNNSLHEPDRAELARPKSRYIRDCLAKQAHTRITDRRENHGYEGRGHEGRRIDSHKDNSYRDNTRSMDRDSKRTGPQNHQRRRTDCRSRDC